jgi:hypothetical protein
MHPIEVLFAVMPEVEPYLAGVVRVPARMPGTAFFPGGAGLWDIQPDRPLPPMPVGGVMVLGHDFHSEDAFARSFAQRTAVPATARSAHRRNPMWRNLLPLLSDVGLPTERCFFTNAYMGLRQGANNTGRFPGACDPGFVERCRCFLLRQLSTQRPSVVLTLGTWVPAFVGPLSPELCGWHDVQSLVEIDCAGSVIHGATFPGADTPACSVVALTHPSLRGSNVGRRRFGVHTGHAAEVAMIREAIAVSELGACAP